MTGGGAAQSLSTSSSAAAAGKKSPSPPPASAADSPISHGISPAQGLLASPPPSKLPDGWRRLLLYILLAFLPMALLHEYMFQRALVFALQSQSSGSDRGSAVAAFSVSLHLGHYPFLSMDASTAGNGSNSSSSSSGSVLTDLRLPLNAATAWAQAFVLFSIVLVSKQ